MESQICTDATRPVALDWDANLAELRLVGELHNHHGCSVLSDCAAFTSFALLI
jgi:hypothetical protein